MALEINIPVRSSRSNPATYWNMSEISIRKGLAVNVSMLGYWSEDDRAAGRSAVGAITLSFPIGVAGEAADASSSTGTGSKAALAALPQIDADSVNAFLRVIYDLVKTSPEFQNAVDI